MTKKFAFESSLKELEEIVREMESGKLSLDEAIKKYEIGIRQAKRLNEFLNSIEQKIIMLSKDTDGSIIENTIKDGHI